MGYYLNKEKIEEGKVNKRERVIVRVTGALESLEPQKNATRGRDGEKSVKSVKERKSELWARV